MSSLYVDRKNAELRADGNALVFFENGERVGTVPLNPLSRVFLRGDVKLSSSLLGKLGEHGVGVVVLNAVLSLTYTLLQSETALALYGAGLDPFIGFYHALDFGRESLACDLMEALRPQADCFVLTLFRKGILTADNFSTSEAGCLLGKAGRGRYYTAYETSAERFRRELEHAVEDVAAAIEEFRAHTEGTA